jgi:hypothetical protein
MQGGLCRFFLLENDSCPDKAGQAFFHHYTGKSLSLYSLNFLGVIVRGIHFNLGSSHLDILSSQNRNVLSHLDILAFDG